MRSCFPCYVGGWGDGRDGWILRGVYDLESVAIPDGVASIGISSFRGCEKIQSVVFGSLPHSLELGEGIADGYLRNLFPDSYATLTNVTLGSAVTELPDGFFDQDALASVAFQDTLEYVGVGAFRLCTGLARIDLPDGLDAAKVTVKVPPTVKTVKAPAGAKVKVMRDGHDITGFLDNPNADASGAVDLASATVKEEIAREPLDARKGAEIRLDNPSKPSLVTAPTKPGLVYTLREGATLDAMKDGDSTVGDGAAWTPAVTVKGGASGFYSIRVSK